MLAGPQYFKGLEDSYPGSSIFYCAKCGKKSSMPHYSSLGRESILQMLTDDWILQDKKHG